MAVERERKFLVRGESWRSAIVETLPIRQGYVVSTTSKSLRVRQLGERAFLTIKAGIDPLQRLEFEYEIPIADAMVLLESVCDGVVLAKLRHRISAEDGLVWEVDEFQGQLSGLILAEIELPQNRYDVDRPSWLGEEVTQDPRYLNANLAKDGASVTLT